MASLAQGFIDCFKAEADFALKQLRGLLEEYEDPAAIAALATNTLPPVPPADGSLTFFDVYEYLGASPANQVPQQRTIAVQLIDDPDQIESNRRRLGETDLSRRGIEVTLDSSPIELGPQSHRGSALVYTPVRAVTLYQHDPAGTYQLDALFKTLAVSRFAQQGTRRVRTIRRPTAAPAEVPAMRQLLFHFPCDTDRIEGNGVRRFTTA